jgi:hypothetical protein
MEDQDKVDNYIKLAEYWASRHDGRREFEWKVTLAWWGLLVLGIHYVHSAVFQLASKWVYLPMSIVVAAILLAAFVYLWLFPLWRANARDRGQSIAAADRALAMLNSEIPTRKDGIDVSFKRFAKDWSMQFQTFASILLLVVLCISARY